MSDTLLGSARVRLRPSTEGFEREANRGLVGPLKKVAAAATVALAGIGVAQGLKDSIAEASDLSESINALNVSYGKSSAGVQKLGKAAADALGLSNVEFNNLAVRFSAFSKTIAGDGGDVVGTLEDLTGRASDFASVMNLDVSEAARLFQSGLAGETEPLRQFGIDLSAAAVEAHAVAVGIADSSGEMTEAEKVQGRYSLLMEQTAQTAGDFANTSDDLANAQRRVAARFDDVKARVGAVLLPALELATGFLLNNALPAVESFASGLGDVDLGVLEDVDWSGLAASAGTAAADARTALIDGFNDLTVDIDFSSLFGGIADDAAEAGGDVISGLRTAVETGDWKPVGVALGSALRTALSNLGDLGSSLFDIISNAIDSVDWPALAVAWGRAVPAIAIGFLIGLLDFDWGAVWNVLADNWQAVLLGALGLLFAPAKLIAPIAKALRKVPLVGRFAAWLLEAINGVGGKIAGWVGGIVKRFGEGFRAGGPTIVGRVADIFDTVRTTLFVWADDVLIWFRALPGRFTEWVGTWAMRMGIGVRMMVDDFVRFIRGMWTTAGAIFRAGINAVLQVLAPIIVRVLGTVRSLRTQMDTALAALWQGVKVAFRAGVAAAAAIFLGLVSTLVNGAAEAFGWVPGIGDKLNAAAASFNTFKDKVNTSLSGIKDRDVAIRAELDATAANLVKAGATPAQAAKRLQNIKRATGGSVIGAGTSTSDSIPAMLSNGEHVWTAKEVAKAGGHGAVEQMRREVLYRANGGRVERGLRVTPKLPPTDDFDVLATRLNEGSAALAQSMKDRVAGLARAANAAAAASDAVGGGGPLPAISKAGWMRPGRGGRITSEFGMRFHPIRRTNRLHNGIDVAGLAGSRVLAAQAGRVTKAGRVGSYGNFAEITHGGGLGKTGYAHLARIAVKVGQTVARGALVGIEGATGGVIGKHLHFNWNRGGWRNPRGMGVFDDGGLARGLGYLPKATLEPERVLSGRQTSAFEDWMRGEHAAQAPPNVEVKVLIDGQRLDARAEVIVHRELAATARADSHHVSWGH